MIKHLGTPSISSSPLHYVSFNTNHSSGWQSNEEHLYLFDIHLYPKTGNVFYIKQYNIVEVSFEKMLSGQVFILILIIFSKQKININN